ncbi:hypothetical protein AeMF1_000913 [Aphanomyces euteiches]|nr:hypothetical protein AeMF1_000913 [Aphanomyces euteiches]KAH9189813.1 hypothetical protein AeNC1_008207 [Aphanomyces euteiches]
MDNSVTTSLWEDSLPPFQRLDAANISAAVRAAIDDMVLEMNSMEDDLSTPNAELSWELVMDRQEMLADSVDRMWVVLTKLTEVVSTPELQKAKADLESDVAKVLTRRVQSVEICRAMEILRAGPEWSSYSVEQKRILNRAILQARLNGVGLLDDEKMRFNEIQLRLRQLENQFQSNILQAADADALIVHDKSELEGIPSNLLAVMARRSVAAGHTEATAEGGPWKVSADASLYRAVMQNCINRKFRQRFHKVYVTKCSSGPLDNRPIMQEILDLRHERAQILGFNSYAELSLATKTAPSVLSVTEMINDLRDAAYPVAEAELHQLQEYALAHGQTEPMEPYDVDYWRVELSKETMVLDHEVIKEYFPRAKVLEGMFELASQLFGIRVEPGDESVETWHPDVQFYQIRSMERPGEPVIAYFYMDPYARPGQKRIGSWTQLLVARSKVIGTPEMPIRLPVFSIVCNQIPPADDESPNLMPFDSILQLFRNFGHGLRVALNQAEYSFASNFDGVELEALEMTAVLWQYFCFDRGVIQMISSHYKTGAPLPDNLLESLVAARKYMAATDLLRQMRFAATDTALHHYYDPDSSESIRQIQLQIDERFCVLPPIPGDQQVCSFPHAFDGKAMVAGYKWAEMVTADAFAMFDESKHEDWKVIGRKFRDTILANLGIYHPMEAFQMFRGRPPRHEALLHIYGLK